MKKILIDCDPGASDALALLMAGRCENMDLVAVTTCYGSCGAETACQNAMKAAAAAGLSIPIARGAEKPLFVDRLPADESGVNDLSGAGFPDITEEPAKWAWDMIYQKAVENSGELTLLTMGPLTNIAIALFQHEDLPKHIKQIVMLGGSAGIGDVTEFGEFNVVSDPHACAVVLRSGIPVTMLGLDALEDVRLSGEEIDTIKAALPAPFAELLARLQNEQMNEGEQGLALPGTVLLSAALNPQIAESTPRHVQVETVRSGMIGRTVVDIRRHSKERPNVDVIGKLSKPAYKKQLEMLVSAAQ